VLIRNPRLAGRLGRCVGGELISTNDAGLRGHGRSLPDERGPSGEDDEIAGRRDVIRRHLRRVPYCLSHCLEAGSGSAATLEFPAQRHDTRWRLVTARSMLRRRRTVCVRQTGQGERVPSLRTRARRADFPNMPDEMCPQWLSRDVMEGSLDAVTLCHEGAPAAAALAPMSARAIVARRARRGHVAAMRTAGDAA
jgi:hypothetical protein